MPCLETMAIEAASLGCISFDLPGCNVVAGRVLKHSIAVVEKTFKRLEPLIFKFGWTHDACWRWNNSLYGYVHDREKWSHMIVLHVCGEPYSPAFLEAALVEKYQSI